MKKIFSILVVALLFNATGFGQELIKNGDFALPNDGKKYSRVDSIPDWCTDATTADENGREYVDDNGVGWAWDEGASIYQVVGTVPATATNYTINFDVCCTYSWWADYTTDLYVIFSTFTGTDTTNRTTIDTVKFTVSCIPDNWGVFSNRNSTYTLAAGNSHAGEHLAIEIKMYNSADFGYGSSYTYLHYDNVSVIASDASSVLVNKMNNLSIFPVPSKNTINLTCDKTIDGAFLFDMTGKQIKASFVNDKIGSMDISELPSGVYFMQVKTNDGLTTSQKIVKE